MPLRKEHLRDREEAEQLPVCPEVEIGLGVPRSPIRVVSGDGGLRLIQPVTDIDVTGRMKDFVHSFLVIR